MSRILYSIVAIACIAAFWLAFRPAPASPDGRLHLKYWEKWTGFEEDAMRAAVNAYNKSQNRVTVDYLAVSEVNRKMLLATAGGDPPDVCGLWDYDVVTFADYNALRPLDDYCRRDGIGPQNYLPPYWMLSTHRGHVYGLPTTPATIALHWNKKLFREAGLDPDRPPRTIEELDAMSEKLTKRDASGNITQMGFLPAEPGWWNWGWGYYFGGSLYDGHGHATCAAPENVRAFNWVKSYVDKYHAQTLSVFQGGFGNFNSPQNAFLDGQVAMVQQGVWMANFIDKNNPSMEWDAAPFPYPADRPDLANATPASMDVLVIPAGSKHPEEAWDFIRFIQSQKGMEILCRGQWKHTPLSSVSPDYFRTHPNKKVRLFWELAKSKNNFAPPRVGIWREWNDEMNACFQQIWNNGQYPKTALTYVDQRIQPKLTRYLESVRLRGGTE